MADTHDNNHSPHLQAVARDLFVGVVPERSQELSQMWSTYSPHFQILGDSGPAGKFVMEAGAYRQVHFNHRILRVFWLSCFAAWEGYNAIHKASNTDTGSANLQRFHEILKCIAKESSSSISNLDHGKQPR